MQGVNRSQDFTELLGEVKGLKRRAKASLELEEIDMDFEPSSSAQRSKPVIPPKQTKTKKESMTWRQICLSCFFFFLLFGSGLGVVLSAFDIFFTGFKYLDVSDAAVATQIFRSADPFVVYCVEPRLKNQPVPAIVVQGMRANSWRANTAAIDCKSAKLPDSGKSVWERFEFSDRLAPVFFVANRDKPSQFPVTALQSPEAFSGFVDSKLKRRFFFLEKNPQKKLKDLCRGRCVLAAYRGNGIDTALQRMTEREMEQFRSFKLLAAEAKSIKLAKTGNLLKMEKTPLHKIGLLCLVEAAEGRVLAGYLSMGSDIKESEISAFLKTCEAGESAKELTELSEYPTIGK